MVWNVTFIFLLAIVNHKLKVCLPLPRTKVAPIVPRQCPGPTPRFRKTAPARLTFLSQRKGGPQSTMACLLLLPLPPP